MAVYKVKYKDNKLEFQSDPDPDPDLDLNINLAAYMVGMVGRKSCCLRWIVPLHIGHDLTL
jgi:hypothetical protein